MSKPFFTEKDEKAFRKFIMAKITYDEETGLFYNKATGKKIGTKDKRGYCRIWINGKPRLAHRIALLIITGKMPLVTDHINGDRSDNRFVNLRSTTPQGNSSNQRVHRNGKIPGISFEYHKKWPKAKHWRARAAINGKRKHLGWFHTKEEAAKAVIDATSELKAKWEVADV